MTNPEISKDKNNYEEKLQKKYHLTDAEEEVLENEDASLQDDSYTFDSENTGIEEYHSADDVLKDEEVRDEDDYLQ